MALHSPRSQRINPSAALVTMLIFSPLDWIALACFAGAWAFYAIVVEWTPLGRRTLNTLMHRYRLIWMQQMLGRDMRMVDAQIVASLQNGSAFFASTSLIAVGGALTVMRGSDELLHLLTALPFDTGTTRTQWEAKVLGLAIIFVYAFFKFAWAYRLFNYVAILLGAAPMVGEKDTPQAQEHAMLTARLIESAGQHFNRGQRAFFFALGYLGWFLGPWVLMAATAAVLLVMLTRQLMSDAQRAVADRLSA